MKLSKLLLSLGLAISLTACSNNTTTETSSDTSAETTEESSTDSSSDESTSDADALTLTGTYEMSVDAFDWGPAVTKVKIKLDKPVDTVDKDTFLVEETKQTTDFTDEKLPVIEQTTEREVTDAYLCDEEGSESKDPSEYVMLELKVDPDTGNPFLYTATTGYNTWSDPYDLAISVNPDATLESEGVKVETVDIEVEADSVVSAADVYKIDSYKTESGVEYNYASYEPEGGSKNLVVWLHGMGEGGSKDVDTDPTVTVLANKATALTQPDFQDTVGGANILVPQSLTFWMDSTGEGKTENGSPVDVVNGSYYTESLHELINHYKEETGSEKVVLAGCSNGGFMTLVMAENYGDEYQGYVAIAEALPDETITDEDINKLKDLPLYFIYSEDDDTVDPTKHEEPTIKRLQEAGAQDLTVVTFDHVTDTTGEYKDEDGNAYQYPGHWSWIYFYNNEVKDDSGKTVFEWIADCLKADLES